MEEIKRRKFLPDKERKSGSAIIGGPRQNLVRSIRAGDRAWVPKKDPGTHIPGHQPTERIVGKGLAMLDVFDTQEAQTAVNIRERAGKRKQKYVTSPESPSKRLRCLFGIQVGLECPRGLEGHLALSDPQRDPQQTAPD